MSEAIRAIPQFAPRRRPWEASSCADEIHRAVGLLQLAPRPGAFEREEAVLENMIRLLTHATAADYEQVVALRQELGAEGLAAVQYDLERLICGPGVPFTTALIAKLLHEARIRHVLAGAGRSPGDGRLTAAACADAAFWLLIAGIDVNDMAPAPATCGELRTLVATRGADQWRRVLAQVAACPWSPCTTHLTALARSADLDRPLADLIEKCATFYRERSAEAERRDVAKEVRRLVAVSGCTQREFARYAGTSASRLSTYASGRVTPSATMMLRIVSVSRALGNARHTARQIRP